MNPILAWLLGEGIDVGAEKTGLKDRARGIMSDLADAIIPPAAASDARSIPQQPVVPDVPVNQTDTGTPLISVTPEMGASASDNQMPFVGGVQPAQLPDMQMQKTPEDIARETQDFVRTIGGRTQALMEEAPEGNPQEAAALATTEALASKGMQDDDGGFFDSVGGFLTDLFGDEERMTRMALAFNSMRLQPDQGLAAVLGKRLETIDARKTAKANAPAIAAQLKQMGYNKMAEYVLANPQHAEKIYEKALTAQLKSPTQFEQLKELAKTPEGRAQIKEWKDLGVIGGQTINVGGSAGEKLAVADVQPIYQAAFNAPTQIEKIDETLNILESGGANTGMFSNLKQARDRFLAELGGSDAAQRASDTQLLNAFLGSEVFAMISKLGLGSRGMDTPAEREFLREVMTGKVDLTPQALIALANRRRDAEIGAIKAYEREKDSPAMKAYASQRSAIDYTSKDFERKKPEAKPQKRIRYDAQGNRI